MVYADKDWFCEQLKNFALVAGRSFTSEQKQVYWDVLKELSREEFERAYNHLMKSWQWPRMPYPSDFFKAAKNAGWT
jgi:hypothetical protein